MSKSPFPGMDPWLESRWPEVHARLIVYAANQINASLPDDLQANIEETLAVHEDNDFRHSIRPDVHVSEDASLASSQSHEVDIAVADPVVVNRFSDPDRRLEIASRDGRVITAIEFLSPWNKVGSRGREQYLRKQEDYIAAGINLVEIDLVKQGTPLFPPEVEQLDPSRLAPYMICVYREIRPDQVEIYRAPLQERLPNIPIPLRSGERDVPLQLQSLIDDCYRDGRYHRADYSKPPPASFDDADTEWIDAHLKASGHRE